MCKPEIENFDALCAVLEVVGVEGFEDWLEAVHDEPEWSECETEISDWGVRTHIQHFRIQNADFELKFPCSLDDVHDAVRTLEDFVVRHRHACYLSIDEFGDPGSDLDRTADVAQLLYVEPTALVAAVGGPWVPVEDGPQWDESGALIYHWFGRGEPATVWLGIGGDCIYVEPVHIHGDGTTSVETWPSPATANLLYAEAENWPLTETEFLERLHEAVESPPPPMAPIGS